MGNSTQSIKDNWAVWCSWDISRHTLEVGELVLVHRNRAVVVQSLGGQHLGQLALGAGGLLDLGPLVLEPDLDLVLIQTELIGKIPPVENNKIVLWT